MRETQNINLSLTTLGDVLSSLSKLHTKEDRAAKIRECLEYQPKEQFEISYVYYRTNSGTLAVSEHPEFILRQHARVA